MAVLEPLGAGQGLAFGAVAISAAMIGGALVAAGVTLLQVAAQGGSPAEFDGAHHAPLPARERSCVLLPVRRTIAAKDIRHFELRTLHGAEGSEILRCERASIQRPPAAGANQRGWWWSTPCWWRCAGSGPSSPGCDARAAVGCVRTSVPCSSRWTEKAWRMRMWGDGFGDAGGSMRFSARQLHSVPGDVAARDIAWEEPRLGLFHAPPLPQDFQQLGREHDVAIFLPLALLDADDHALAIDVGGFQPDGLGDSQPGGVTGRQDGPVLGAGHATEKVPDLFRAENDGQFLGFLGCGNDVFQAPILVQGDLVEETQGGHRDEDGTGSQLLFIGQVHLVGTNLFRPQLVGWFAGSIEQTAIPAERRWIG